MKKVSRKGKCCWGGAVMMVAAGWAADARAQVQVSADFDGWIRVEDSFVREGDFISVWSSEFGVRYGLLQFDVSQFAGKSLLGVSLDLYLPGSGTGSSLDEPEKQTAFCIDTGGGTPMGLGLTWAVYQAEYEGQATETAFETLGTYDLPPVTGNPGVGNVFHNSVASAADIAKVEAAANSASGLLNIVFKAVEDGGGYKGDWGDENGTGGSLRAVLNVDDGSACAISTTSLLDALEGDPYSATVQQDGTCTNPDWSISAGALPTGLTINSATGEISGVPDGTGTFDFDVQVDADEGIRTKTLSITVLPFVGLTTIAAGVDVWISESFTQDTTREADLLSVYSTNAPNGRRVGLVRWDVSSLAGKTLQSAKISLLERADQTSNVDPIKQQPAFQIDTSGGTSLGSQTWNTYVAELLGNETVLDSLGAYDLPAATVTEYKDSDAASAADLAAIEAAANGSGVFEVALWAVEDGNSYRVDWGDIELAGAPPLLIVDDGTACFISTESLPAGEPFEPYSATLETSGACTGATLTWSVGGGALPDGLGIVASTGTIAGTPTKCGTFSFEARVDSSDGFFRKKSLTISVGTPLVASGDSWVREADPGATFENDLVSVWSAASGDGGGANRRAGLVEFDVSSLAGQTLAGARLSLFANRGCCPLKQIASEFPTAGPVGTLSWNDVNPGIGGLDPFDQLGSYDLAAGEGVGSYNDSAEATQADLDQIEAAASGDGVLSILLGAVEDGTDYEQDWLDGPHGAPLLLCVEIAPPPSVPALTSWGMVGLAMLLVTSAVFIRRRQVTTA